MRGALVTLSCGDVYVDWDTESSVGTAYRTAAITIKNKSPKTKEYLGTLAHEVLHMTFPELTEAEVVRAEKDLAEVLWVRGYRLADTRPRKTKIKA